MTEIEKGQLTTDIVTYITPILATIGIYVTENPGPLEQYLGVFWTGLILAIIAAAIANYKNPRPAELAKGQSLTSEYKKGYVAGYQAQQGTTDSKEDK